MSAPDRALPIAVERWEAALELLQKARDTGGLVAVTGHIDPDGDALGALLAIEVSLADLGWRTTAVLGDEPFGVPAAFEFLPGVERVGAVADLAERPAVLVTCDAASADRLGGSAALLTDVPTIVIDHHTTNTGFGTVHLVDPTAAATVVVADELIRRLGVTTYTPELATCLYVGLVTDTGRFQHATTDPAAHELAARLLGAGIDHAAITRRLYGSNRFDYLHLLGEVLSSATLDPDLRLVHARITQAQLVRHGVTVEETEAVIDLLRTAVEATTALILKERPDGSWKGSMRSDGTVDVAAVAGRFGGGGHAAAAGFTAAGPPDAIVAAVRAELPVPPADDRRSA